jgi:DNA primase
MVNELLINLVNNILGSGKRTSRGNVAYNCPFCHKHNKLEINFTENTDGENKWACWSCSNRGKFIHTLFKKLSIAPDKYQELRKLTKSTFHADLGTPQYKSIELPKEFTTFMDNKDPYAHKVFKYLKQRNISSQDILKYNIGYCKVGAYANRVVLPSYDIDGKLNYFTARSLDQYNHIKYMNPDISRDIIPFGMFINWDLPIIICEGPFDALAIKRNAIPLMGKNMQSELMKKLVESKVHKIYIALDADAIQRSISFCEKLLDMGKEVYLVELDGKDPSELGFEHFTKLIQTVTPLTQYKLMERKLNLI